jgi:DNA segregation ATPase FtsK/SpoIIIE, S-DNA-T family
VILRFTVTDAQAGADHDVEVTADPAGTVESVLAALPGPVAGRACFVGAEPLDPTASIEDSPLIMGARLTIGAPGVATRASSGRTVGVLRVVAGPDVGRSYPLTFGAHVIGRSARADIPVADPMVSRAHATVHVTANVTANGSANGSANTVSVTDSGSSNGTSVAGHPVSGPAPVPPGARIQVGDDLLEYIPVQAENAAPTRSSDGRLEFDRAFAAAPAIPRPQVRLPAAPNAQGGVKALIMAAAAPVVLGVVMAVVLRQVYMLMFAAFAPASALVSFLMERRQRRARGQEFDTARRTASEQIESAVRSEERLRRQLAPDQTDLTLTATGAARGLWPRNLDSPDGLVLRVGTADRPASIDLTGDRWDGFVEPVLHSVPVTVDLRTTGVLGVVGRRGEAERLTNWLLAQLATLRSPDDLRLVVLTPDDAEELAWTRWLPHVDGGDDSAVPCWIGNTRSTRQARVEELKELIKVRQDARTEPGRADFDEEIVVVLHGALADRKLPGMRELLREGFAVGVYCICVDESDMNECRGVVELDGETVVLRRRRSDHPEAAHVEAMLADDAEHLARTLAPMRDRLTRRDDPNTIPYPVRFLDLLDVVVPTADDVLTGWKAVAGPTLEVPLGLDARGTVRVDLAGQGPHTMLAGATGAGKSILLQTLVTSLLLANRPDELSLVLVDFKGGSAFLPFEHCPHVVALIRSTEDDPAKAFDEAAAARVLASIRAEVRRRESILARYEGEIDAYWAERERRPSLPALPRLVMVFDEFARAIEVSPDFPKELVNVAGKGRSLGMHLVLATQSMQQKLSPEMKNNISLRITLRQNERTDSVEVLGVPDAATIPGRLHGRGMILCTKDEVRLPRTFQSGYLGNPPPTGAAPPARLRLVDWPTVGLPRPRAKDAATNVDTDQDLAIAAVVAAAGRLALPPSLRPLLPPLPAVVTLEELPAIATRPVPRTALVLGLADDPDAQQQPPAALDLADSERLMIAGGPQSGRTTAVRTLITSLAERFTPQQAHLYVIEERPAGLADYSALPHCGAVMSPAEPERIRRLVGRLAAQTRQRALARPAPGVSPGPWIVLIVDGWEGLENRGDGPFDETTVLGMLREIIAGGPPVGIHVVAVGGQQMLTSRLPDAFSRRVLLRFPNETTRRAGLPAGSTSPPDLPGRAVDASSRRHLQIAETRRSARDLATAQPVDPVSGGPLRFPSFPDLVTTAEVGTALAPTPTWIPIGVGGAQVAPVGLDLFDADPHLLLISGAAGSGRSTAAATMIAGLLTVGIDVLAVVPPRSPLPSLVADSRVRYLTGTTLADTELRDAVTTFEGGRYAVVIDDCEQITVTASMVNFAPGPTLLEDLADPASAGRRALILAGDAGAIIDGARRSLARTVEAMIANGTRISLAPTARYAAKQLGIVLERDQLLPAPPGRGHLTDGRTVQLVQLAVAPVGA